MSINSHGYKRGYTRAVPAETSPSHNPILQKQSSSESQTSNFSQSPSSKKTKFLKDPPAKNPPNQKEVEWLMLFDRALKILEHCGPGEEVGVLLSHLQQSRATWCKIKKQIRADMLKLMKPLNVKEILVFGSTLTGIDFTGSDLDYYVQLVEDPVDKAEVKKIILKVAKLTRHYTNHEFRTIYTIQNARVPIIRLLHQHTRITCDINFTSQFGFYNSFFIGQVLSYDERIKGLGVILKLWSKTYKIAEKMILSNYCLIMLMIFYLQNLEHPMLDCIKNVQANCEPMILDPKYRWNVHFNDAINKSHENHLTLLQLLIGFFDFYQKINALNYVVSLYNGQLILKKDFNAHPDLEASRKIIAENELSTMNIENPQSFIVQDGFELNLNIGIKCKKHVDTFFELVKLSYDKTNEFKNETLSTVIIKLLTDIKIPSKTNEPKVDEKAKKKFQMILHPLADDLRVS
jgi:predicted nucleotidyltransferase